MKGKSILVVGVLLSVITAHAQTADEVIDKYLNAIGGTANWKKVTTLTASGKMTMMGAELPMKVYSKPPNKTKVVITFQGTEIVQAYDGADAWMLNPLMGSKEPQKIPAEQAKEMTDDEFENEFIDFKKKGFTAKYAGTGDVDGVKCDKIEFTKKGSTSTHYIDAENHVTLMVKSVAESGPAAGQEVSRYLSDYQEVNGLMIPFSTEVKVGGQTAQKLVFEKVTLNEAIDDSVFAFPKK